MNSSFKSRFDKPEDSSGYLLWQVTMLWQRKMNRELNNLDITHTQFVILAALAWLSQNDSLVTQVDIANHSKTDRMMVSKVLRTLETKKLITRKEHPSDTRAKCVSLTKKGSDFFEKAIKLVEDVDHSFFSLLGENQKSFNSSMHLLMQENE